MNYDSIFKKSEVYYSIFDCMSDEVFVFDLNARLIYMNRAAEESEGFQLSDKKGCSLFELYNFENDIRLDRSPVYLALTNHQEVDKMVCAYHIGGKLNRKEISCRLIYLNEEIIGAYTIQRDVNDIYNLMDENISLQKQIIEERSVKKELGKDPFSEFLSYGDAMDSCLSIARNASKTESNVLISGKPGCDKGLLARAIHDSSSRANNPFIRLNCNHLSEDILDSMIFGSLYNMKHGESIGGILEQAEGGTVYLEDVTCLPLSIQKKLVRFCESKGRFNVIGDLKERVADVRIIASCVESSLEIMRDQRMEIGLFYCLAVVYIQVPRLSERVDEIPKLTSYYIDYYNRKLHKNVKGIDSVALSYCKVYGWPGNNRQFRSFMESCVNLAEDGTCIETEDLPETMFYGLEQDAYDPGQVRRHASQAKEQVILQYDEGIASMNRQRIAEDAMLQEKRKVIEALQETNGNITHAADLLGISRQLLYYRMKKYGLN